MEFRANYNSKNLSDGTIIAVNCKFNVTAEKKTAIAAGANGSAKVVSIEKAKGLGKPGRIELQLLSVETVDHQQAL